MEAPSLRPCAIFVANRAFALANSRLLLMRSLIVAGWQVVAATVLDEHADTLADVGVKLEEVRFARSGLAPNRDMQAFLRLKRLYVQYQPRLIHHFHAKPMILGTLAAKSLPDCKVFNTVTGLGHAFIKGGLSRPLAKLGYKSLLKHSQAVIFQNRDDRQLFLEQGWAPTERSPLIVSSGIDSQRFRPRPRAAHDDLRVLMVGRLIWQKGVREFVEAAELLRERFPQARFQLAGEWDDVHPDAVPRGYIEQAHQRGTIEFLGYVHDLDVRLPETDVFVLPSYREGVPRVLLEASACHVPLIASDVPGCREAVTDGENGLLVPVENSHALAEAIERLLADRLLRERLGKAGRRRVEAEFDVRIITQRQLDLYREAGLPIESAGSQTWQRRAA